MFFIRGIITRLLLLVAMLVLLAIHPSLAQQGQASLVMGWAPEFSARFDNVPGPFTPGTGYSVGEVITLNDGCPTHAVVTVATVGTRGALLTYTLTNAGFCKFLAFVDNPIPQLSTTGSGKNATFHLKFGLINQGYQTGVSINGLPMFGTNLSSALSGPSTGPAIVIQNTVDPSILTSGSYRLNQFITHVVPSLSTSKIVENVYSASLVDGPGITSTELNQVHGYLQVNAGAHVSQDENFESSAFNSGTLDNFVSYLSLPDNLATGTMNSVQSLKFQLLNDNPAAGSVNNYIGLYMAAMGGAGSLPTNYQFIQNNEPNADIVTLGGLHVGSTASVGAGMFRVNGPDNSGSTASFQIQSNNAAGLFYVFDDGTALLFNGVLKLGNAGITSQINMTNNTSGSISIRPQAGVALSGIQTFPAGTYNVVGTTLSNTFTAPQKITPVATSALPTCGVGVAGTFATVNDATSPTYNGVLTGGGATIVPVFCNGTNWTTH